VRYCCLPSEVKHYVCYEHIKTELTVLHKNHPVSYGHKVIHGFMFISPAATAVLSWTDTWLGSSFAVL
jgi:hypothetical protein